MFARAEGKQLKEVLTATGSGTAYRSYSLFTIQYPVPLFSLCTKSLIAKDAKQLSEEKGGGPFC